MWCGVFFFAVLVIPVSRLRGGFCAVCARGVGILFAFVCVEIDWQSVTLRYKLPDDSLQGALAAARSKAHSASAAHAWFALRSNSRSAAVSAVPSYCRSMRV